MRFNKTLDLCSTIPTDNMETGSLPVGQIKLKRTDLFLHRWQWDVSITLTQGVLTSDRYNLDLL